MKASSFVQICRLSSAETISCWMINWTPQLSSQLQLHQSDPVYAMSYSTRDRHYSTYAEFVCNPLIIDVKAIIYKWSVRSVFENANSRLSSPLIIKRDFVHMFETHIAVADEQLIIRSNEDVWIHQSSIFFTDSFVFSRQTMMGFVWWQLFHPHKCSNYFPNCFLVKIRSRYTLPGFSFTSFFI